MNFSASVKPRLYRCANLKAFENSSAFSRRAFIKTAAVFSAAGLSNVGHGEARNSNTGHANNSGSEKLQKNARIVLEISCRAKAGENLLILADDILMPYAAALSDAALALKLIPLTIDIRPYLLTPAYQNGMVLEPLKSAIESADIVIENLADTWVPNRPDFGRLLGNPDFQDKALTGERRWVILQCNGMENWEITPEEVAKIKKRTVWLEKKLRSAKEGRITTSKGTDLTFRLFPNAAFTPVMGIVPLYGEVAVTPALAGTTGMFVADGPSQRDVRPKNELDREPLVIALRDGRVTEMKGDAVQLKRLKDFVASGDPPADAVDEIGILTTTFKENDLYYWSDGTHHHDCVHIALGNNVRRDVVVHGPKHTDFEVRKPTISLDDIIIVKDGVFQDFGF